MKALPLVLGSALTLFAALASAESRKWTDVTGRAIDAEFVSADATSVTLRLPSGQVANVPKTRLSQNDLDFVATAVPATTAPVAASSSTGKGPAYFQATVAKDSWKVQSPPETFGVTGYDFGPQLHTPHSIVAGSQKVKNGMLESYAENLERLFAQMSADFSAPADAATAPRWLVILTANEEEHRKMGVALGTLGEVSIEWDTSNGTWVTLSDECQSAHRLQSTARVFRADADTYNQAPSRNPKRIHFLTSGMVNGFIPNYRQNNYTMSLFRLVYSYYLEHLVSGRIETKVRFSGASGGVEGFENGKDWPGVARRLLLKSPVRPSIEKFTSMDATDAEPIDLAFGFCLIRRILSDPSMQKKFAETVTSCKNDRRPLLPTDYATIFGCNSPDELDEQWLQFMKK